MTSALYMMALMVWAKENKPVIPEAPWRFDEVSESLQAAGRGTVYRQRWRARTAVEKLAHGKAASYRLRASLA